MKKLKFKVLLAMLIIGVFTIGIPMISYGANENTVIVREGNEAHIYYIYLEGYLKKDFQFAFSDNADESKKALLEFKNSALDSTEANANHIAYIENTTTITAPLYMWVKLDGNIKIEKREIDINDYITKSELENISTVSHRIETKEEQEEIVNTTNAEGTKITKTVGIVKITTPILNGKFQLIKKVKETEYASLFELAEKLSKGNYINTYEQIKTSKDFISLARKLHGELKDENWKAIENNKIYQPEDTKKGDQYILWLKGDNIEDVHFMTSKMDYKEEVIKEEVRTKLPKTYDDNTVLVILGIVLVAIVFVVIRIAYLKKKEMNK